PRDLLSFPTRRSSDLVEVVLFPMGGGGLAAGAGSYLKQALPELNIIGVEPLGAPSMTRALEHGGPVTLETVNSFIDGAAVKRMRSEEHTSELQSRENI